MPRGVVIAVTPDSFVSDSEVMFARSMEMGSQSTGRAGVPKAGNLVYIKVGNGMGNSPVLWYVDEESKLQIDDHVEFTGIDDTKTKPLKAAIGVRKIHGKIIGVQRKTFLPQIALLAAALLIVAVSLDIKRL